MWTCERMLMVCKYRQYLKKIELNYLVLLQKSTPSTCYQKKEGGRKIRKINRQNNHLPKQCKLNNIHPHKNNNTKNTTTNQPTIKTTTKYKGKNTQINNTHTNTHTHTHTQKTMQWWLTNTLSTVGKSSVAPKMSDEWWGKGLKDKNNSLVHLYNTQHCILRNLLAFI